MGGSMAVKSDVDQGSTFYFTIVAPATVNQGLNRTVEQLTNQSINQLIRQISHKPNSTNQNLQGITNSSANSSANAPSKNLSNLTHPNRQNYPFNPLMARDHPLRILLAEDNVINQKVAQHIFQRMGYRADVAANGLEVLAAIAQQTYDLIFMDMQMPEMDGLEATRQIYQRLQSGDLTIRPRIVAMTANAMQGDREICLNAGMDDYISKPINNADLVRVLQECVSVAPTTTNSLSVNLTTLHEVASDIGGEDPEFLAELIDSYLDNARSLLQEIYTSFAEKNFEVMTRTVHTLKSSSSVIGADDLSNLCRGLETNLRNQNYEDLDIKISKIADEYSSVQSELERQKYN
jgi:CheY-like chemotaxis protein